MDVGWLQAAIPRFFGGAAFEIGLMPGEDGLLSAKVYANLPPQVFRKRRHQMCEAMRAAGRKALYEAVGIFQRRTDAWKS